MQQQLNDIEKEIEGLKLKNTDIEKMLEDSANADKVGTLSEQYQQNENLLNSKNKVFETIFEQLLSL